MARGVNKVIIVGNLGADPEVKFTPNGTAVANFNVATTEGIKNAAGEWEDKTEWHRIVVWGKLAENCGNYLAKGRQVYIEGKIQTRAWEDGQGVKRYTTEIVARDIQFLGGGQGGEQQSQSQQQKPVQQQPERSGAGGPDQDIPFAPSFF